MQIFNKHGLMVRLSRGLPRGSLSDRSEIGQPPIATTSQTAQTANGISRDDSPAERIVLVSVPAAFTSISVLASHSC